ncbi:unnamed protein product, partial [Staurois parvus]
HKWSPPFWPVHAPWERLAPRSSACCVRRNNDRCTRPLCEVLIHVITDWPINDHMNSSKQDVTSDIIAYYLKNL